MFAKISTKFLFTSLFCILILFWINLSSFVFETGDIKKVLNYFESPYYYYPSGLSPILFFWKFITPNFILFFFSYIFLLLYTFLNAFNRSLNPIESIVAILSFYLVFNNLLFNLIPQGITFILFFIFIRLFNNKFNLSLILLCLFSIWVHLAFIFVFISIVFSRAINYKTSLYLYFFSAILYVFEIPLILFNSVSNYPEFYSYFSFLPFSDDYQVGFKPIFFIISLVVFLIPRGDKCSLYLFKLYFTLASFSFLLSFLFYYDRYFIYAVSLLPILFLNNVRFKI